MSILTIIEKVRQHVAAGDTKTVLSYPELQDLQNLTYSHEILLKYLKDSVKFLELMIENGSPVNEGTQVMIRHTIKSYTEAIRVAEGANDEPEIARSVSTR
jgi:hypothetical protein